MCRLEEELATIQLTVGNVQQEMAALSAERDALSVTLVNQQAAAQRQIDDLMVSLNCWPYHIWTSQRLADNLVRKPIK